MALDVTTKDCTALSDAELAEMADLCADGGICYEIGTLSKQAEQWVLVTLVKDGNHLRGFSFSTLERIGGTPCILLGLGEVKRTSKRDSVLKAVIGDNLRRALMAFPDEDVVIGSRFVTADGLEGFKQLQEMIPRPSHRAVGEERAWGRRLARRFGVDSTYDEQHFVVTANGQSGFLDHESLKPEKVKPEVAALFATVNPRKGGSLVVHGWVMAEDLVKLGAR
jgi:hypothetical protein